jgi:hypothetical protein
MRDPGSNAKKESFSQFMKQFVAIVLMDEGIEIHESAKQDANVDSRRIEIRQPRSNPKCRSPMQREKQKAESV